MALEPAVVAQAIEHATAEELDAIEANIAATQSVQHAASAVASLDAEFHGLVAKAAHNRVLLLAKEPSSMLVMPTVGLSRTDNPAGIARLIGAQPPAPA